MAEKSRTDEKKLTRILENYIEIIFTEESEQGAARASSIADKAKVSRSTVTSALKNLKSMGYIDYSPYSLIHLTEEGKKIGKDLSHRHVIFKEFFHNILQLTDAESDEVACELEHVVPLEATKRLGQFLVYLRDKGDIIDSWQEEYKKLRQQIIKEAERNEVQRLKEESKKNKEENIDTIKKYL